jgi:predicted RNA polymerase sigma factor
VSGRIQGTRLAAGYITCGRRSGSRLNAELAMLEDVADLLRRLGRYEEAADAYREALVRSENLAERNFLEHRLPEVTSRNGQPR